MQVCTWLSPWLNPRSDLTTDPRQVARTQRAPLCAQPYDPSLWPDALPAAPHVLHADLPPRQPDDTGAPVGRNCCNVRLRSPATACHGCSL